MKRWVVHPFLLAAYPILALYARNQHSVAFWETLGPVALALAGAAAIWALADLLFPDAHRSAIVASAVVLVFFTYGYAKEWLATHLPVDPEQYVRHRYLLVVVALVLGGVVLLVRRARGDATKATRILNLVAVFLVALPLATAGYQATLGGAATHAPPSGSVARTVPDGAEASLPNVYVIVLDAYANAATLRDKFQHDNRLFEEGLEASGFRVVNDSRSNYPTTTLSLASALNLRYVDDLVAARPPDSTDYFLPFGYIDENRAVDVARANGYRYVHFGSGWGPTAQDARAWRSIDCEGHTPFQQSLIRLSMMNVLAGAFNTLELEKRARVECQFAALARVPAMRSEGEGPLLVFAHIMMPHGPYVFGEAGELVSAGNPDSAIVEVGASAVARERAAYRAQLVHTNRLVLDAARAIIAAESVPPVIVLASDHGSAFAWDASDEVVRERMRNFMAVKLPGHEEAIADDMTLVNVMRAVWRETMGADLPRLEDKSYFQPDGTRHFYRLVDVTDVVSREAPEPAAP